jgi:hypothetical protein
LGNKTGWIVGGILLAAVVIFLMLFVFSPLPSAPYMTNEPGFMELKVPQTPLDAIIPAAPTGAGNAADDYAKAMTFYKQHAADIDRTADIAPYNAATASPDPWANPDFKACRDLADIVAEGAKKAEFRYTFVLTPKKLKPYFQVDFARDMYQICLGPFQCYQVCKDRKEYPKAEKYMQDTFILGWHMFNERMLADMSMQGLDIMVEAVRYLQELYRVWPEAPKDRLRSLKEYENELLSIREYDRKKKRLLWDSLPLNLSKAGDQFYPGDVLVMAEKEEDHAWKVQAVLTLGPMKYRAVGRGDVKMALSLIQKYLRSEDQLLKAAAECSNDMTKDQYQRLGLIEEEDEK